VSEGGFITDAVEVIDTSRRTGGRVLVEAGGVRPRRGRGLKGRCLSFAEREEIGLCRAGGLSVRVIATELGRSRSTISWELRGDVHVGGGYRGSSAHAMAYHRAWRPKPWKLAVNLALRAVVEQGSGEEVLPGADHRPAACAVPRRPGDAGVTRDDLSVDLGAVPGRVAPGFGGVSAHRVGVAAPEPQGRATQEPHPEHDQPQ
jgi:hypothetical protein